MTKKELIALLDSLPDDLQVFQRYWICSDLEGDDIERMVMVSSVYVEDVTEKKYSVGSKKLEKAIIIN